MIEIKHKRPGDCVVRALSALCHNHHDEKIAEAMRLNVYCKGVHKDWVPHGLSLLGVQYERKHPEITLGNFLVYEREAYGMLVVDYYSLSGHAIGCFHGVTMDDEATPPRAFLDWLVVDYYEFLSPRREVSECQPSKGVACVSHVDLPRLMGTQLTRFQDTRTPVSGV